MRTTNPAKAKTLEVIEKIVFPDATEQITHGVTGQSVKKITVGPTPDPSPAVEDLWVDTN